MVVWAIDRPRSPIISTRSRKLSLKRRYHRTHRTMTSRSKCRPLNRSSKPKNLATAPPHKPTNGLHDSGPTHLHQSPMKLVAAGQRLDDVFRLIAINSRFPRLLLGDLEAQLGGCVMGRDLIVAILLKYGQEAVNAAIRAMWQDADAAVARVLGSL